MGSSSKPYSKSSSALGTEERQRHGTWDTLGTGIPWWPPLWWPRAPAVGLSRSPAPRWHPPGRRVGVVGVPGAALGGRAAAIVQRGLRAVVWGAAACNTPRGATTVAWVSPQPHIPLPLSPPCPQCPFFPAPSLQKMGPGSLPPPWDPPNPRPVSPIDPPSIPGPPPATHHHAGASGSRTWGCGSLSHTWGSGSRTWGCARRSMSSHRGAASR